MDKVFGGGLGASPPEAERFLPFINWFMAVWDIVFRWKKYRPDRPGKDDRPYLPLCLRFDYRDTPPLGPGAKLPEAKHFLASERLVLYKKWTENKNYIMEIV